jgi:2-polyprenyl-3-methyl-5-hydroxy-6-metoxy-1,4-benzoquinol methylase
LDNPRKAGSLGTPSLGEESQTLASPELKHTGERYLPGISMGTAEITYDHIARYRFAEGYVKGKKTVDLGSGAGYGTHSLSKFAEDVLGVDLSEEAVKYAAWHYGAPNLCYEAGDVTNLSYPDESFEAAVSFEVIEHLEHPEALVEEALRLLKEDGVFVVSTPDKQSYSNDRNHVNRHHLKEMYPLEFREVLERHFRHVQIYRQGALAGNIITPDPKDLPENGRLTLESTHFSLPDPSFGRKVPTTFYMLAVCTNAQDPEPLRAPHLILDCDRQIYAEQADWQAMLGQLRMYHSYKIHQLQERIHKLRRNIESMQGTRGWRIARRIDGFEAGVRRILRRG